MALFTTALGLYSGVLWSGERQASILHEVMIPTYTGPAAALSKSNQRLGMPFGVHLDRSGRVYGKFGEFFLPPRYLRPPGAPPWLALSAKLTSRGPLASGCAGQPSFCHIQASKRHSGGPSSRWAPSAGGTAWPVTALYSGFWPSRPPYFIYAFNFVVASPSTKRALGPSAPPTHPARTQPNEPRRCTNLPSFRCAQKHTSLSIY
jgi:hypothetical protein